MRKIFRLQKNQSGQALVTVLTVGAVASLVALSMMTMRKVVNDSQRSTELSNEGKFLISQITSALSVSTVCQNTFAGKPYVPVAGSDNPMSVTLNFNTFKTLNLAAGQNIGGGLEFGEFTVHNNSPNPGSVFVASVGPTVTYSMYKADIKVYFKASTAGMFAPVSQEVTIPMFFYIDGTNTIQNCLSVNTSAATCDLAGSIWNPFAPSGSQCQPYQYGANYGAYAEPPDKTAPTSAWAKLGGQACTMVGRVGMGTGVTQADCLATCENLGAVCCQYFAPDQECFGNRTTQALFNASCNQCQVMFLATTGTKGVTPWAFTNPFAGNTYTCPAGSTAYQNGVITETQANGKAGTSDIYFPSYECLSTANAGIAANDLATRDSTSAAVVDEATLDQEANDFNTNMNYYCNQLSPPKTFTPYTDDVSPSPIRRVNPGQCY